MSRSSGPTTRSQSRLAIGKDEPLPPPDGDDDPLPVLPKFTEELRSTLIDLSDTDPVHGKDAKELRDATATAVTEAWHDARSTTASLARQISASNLSLLRELNTSFAAVGERVQSQPPVVQCFPEGAIPRLTLFSGSGDSPQFSVWLRRFEDILRMRSVPLSSEQKANFLVGYLEGAAREKVEELSELQRSSYEVIVDHLRSFFESPQRRHLARQALSACQQGPSESSVDFADRIRNLVRVATAGQDIVTQKERTLEEYVARLRGDIRYFVRLDNPTSFEQAVTRAQMVEQLLAEAAGDRLMHPATYSATQPVQALATQVSRMSLARRPPPCGDHATPAPRRNRFTSRQRWDNRRPNQRRPRQYEPGVRCFNCGGHGHLSRQCPSPRDQTPRGINPISGQVVPRGQQRNATMMPFLSPETPALGEPSGHSPPSAPRSIIQDDTTQAQARIAALLQRNQELSQSVFRPHSPRNSHSRSPLSPSVNCILLAIFVGCFIDFATASSAWLCPHDHHDRIFHVPFSYNCSYILPSLNASFDDVMLNIFRPNTRRYSSSAHWCKIVTSSASFSINFFGARSIVHNEATQTVSVEHCRMMAAHHRCDHGSLSLIDGAWRTSHELTVEWPTAPFGCCTTHTVTVTNCLLFNTTIYAQHGDDHPDSLVGDISSCRYRTGSCILRDGSALVWTPIAEESCQYTPIGRMRGQRVGNVWLSDSREFALSWSASSDVLVDCGKTLRVTDQGYAVALIRRSRRSVPPSVGIVTSNQLSAQLLAVEGSTKASVLSLFRHTILALCDRINVLGLSIRTALTINPTLVARRLLGRTDISATYLGNGLLQVHRCLPLSSSRWRFIGFNLTCYSRPRVEIVLPPDLLHHAFFDPDTAVIEDSAPTVPCDTEIFHYISDGSRVLRVDASTGLLSPVPSERLSRLTTLTDPIEFNASLPLTIFHNLVITNLSEIADGPRIRDFGAALEQQRIVEHIANLRNSLSPSPVQAFSLWSLLGDWSPFDIWITVCGCIITLCVLRYVLLIYLGVEEPPTLLPRVTPRRDPVVTQAPPHTLSNQETRQCQEMTVPGPGISHLNTIVIDSQSVWPPKASLVPLRVLALNTSQFFIAQVPVRVNGVGMLALIDTGAAITVSSRGITDLIGVFKLQPSPVRSALGMAGIPVLLAGTAQVHIRIGSVAFHHVIYFTNGPCVPRRVDKYNIILGNDLLARLPPWHINYSRRCLTLGKETIPILTLDLPTCDSPHPQEEVMVRATTTSVVPPRTETLVRCSAISPILSPLMMVTQAPALSDKHLFIAPAVFHPERAVVLITNPTSRPEIVYERQQLGTAIPLSRDVSGLLMDPYLTGNSLSEAPLDALPTIAVTDREPTVNEPAPNVDLSQSDVTDDEKAQLRQLFIEYRDRISSSSYDLGSYTHTLVNIKTTVDTPPSRFRPPRIPVKFQKELDDHINKLLKAGRIVESDTPWVHNTVLVKKRDGSLRVCLDFRPLNDITVPDHYPLPRIEDLLAKISGNRYYTTLDLASGYMQLLMSPQSQEKCGWATHRGIYQFVYLPFGLRNAGAYFCRAMSRILSGLDDHCLAYIDDIIIFNKTFGDHLDTLRTVFERFRLFNIKTSGKKLTEIARSKITFLGHEISFTSYSPAERNIRAVKDFPTPTTAKEVKRFLGMANFFRRFIRHFATLAAPLYELTKDKATFSWGSRQQEAFLALRDCLVRKPCLAYPRDQDFILCTDGSTLAVGAGLFQQAPDDNKKLVAVGYFSKALSDSQRRWSPTHIELFAMVSALRFFRATIYGNRTRVLSDHKPLTFLLKHNKVHDNLARWIVELQSYNITIEYLKGSSNTVADCLSRIDLPSSRFVDNTPDSDDIIDFPRCLVGSPLPQLDSPPLLQYSPVAIRPHDLLVEQQQDAFCKNIIHFLRQGVFSDEITDDRKPFMLQVASQCFIKPNGCLYYHKSSSPPGNRHDLIVVPECLKELLFRAFHESPSAGGHFFWRKTLAKLSRRYYWPHMAEDVYMLCRACDICQRKRAAARNREELLLPVPVAIFDKVYVDLTGPMHTTELGNRYIIAMIDHFSKYVIATPLPDCSSSTVARALMNECILKYGVMTELISDNASYLRSETLLELGKLLRVHRYFCTPYHHEGNGACERVFATFQLMLRSYINASQSDWDQFVPACTFMYNTSTHSSTQNTPFFLMFGRDPSFNVDLILRHHEERHVSSDISTRVYIERLLPVLHSVWRSAYGFNMKQRESYKAQHDKKFLPPLDIKVGDRVYLKNFTPSPGVSAKLCMPWLGQFRVLSVEHPHLVIVSVSCPSSVPRRVHMNQVKRCQLLSGPVFTSPWLPQEEQAALINCHAEDVLIPGYSRSTVIPKDQSPSMPNHQYNTRYRKRMMSL